MVEQVNNILFNLLISGRGVFLPSVGSLYTRYAGARLLTGRRLERGVREVVFTAWERGISLVDAIADAGGCDRKEATDIYDRWLAHTHVDKVLTIDGVGVVRQRHFTPDASLDGLLNPLGRMPVTLRRRGRGRRVAVATTVVLLLAAGCYGAIALLGGRQGWFGIGAEASATVAEDQSSQPAGEIVVAGADRAALVPGDGSLSDRMAEGAGTGAVCVGADKADTTLQAGADDGAAAIEPFDPVASASDTEPSARLTSDAGTDADIASPASTGDVLSGRSAAPDGTGDEGMAEQAMPGGSRPHPDPAVSGSEERFAADDGVPERMTAGRTYLVLGVYSTPENARRAAREAGAKNPDITPRVFVFGRKYMVSIGVFPTREQAVQAIRAYGARFRGLWPYSKQ